MNLAVFVGVDVIAPVIVAALVNGNDAVAVIDAVDEPRNLRRERARNFRGRRSQ